MIVVIWQYYCHYNNAKVGNIKHCNLKYCIITIVLQYCPTLLRLLHNHSEVSDYHDECKA